MISIQVYKVQRRCINNLGLGGDIIKRQYLFTILLASLMIAFVFPPAGAQSTSDNDVKIILNENNSVLKVNAASTTTAKIWYKHWHKCKYKHWYKQWHKHWYKRYGTWHYYWTCNWKYTWKYTWKYSWKFKSVSKVCKCGVGAYNVVVTSKYVYATGRCSCSLYKDYKYHTRVFYNYNPATRHWGVLSFEEGPAGLTSPEGLWVAKDTDMDFCLVHGKSHDCRGVYLVPYNGVINGKKVVNGYFTNITVKTTTKNTSSTKTTTNTTKTPVCT